MAKKQPSRRIASSFTLGGEQAEADPLLHDGFFASSHYSAISTWSDPRCFIVGRTGSGKSALLQKLEETDADHVIRITPEDLSLTYISELGAIRQLSALGVHLDPFFIALWKHVFLIEIIRSRYKINSPEAKQNFFTALMNKVKRDRSKAAALDYLNDFEDKFWCETDERVRDITHKFEQQLKTDGSAAVEIAGVGKVGAGSNAASSFSTETKTQQTDRFQRIVNETQLPRLNKMMSVLDEDILDSSHHTHIIIDDLDRDWVDDQVANDLIRCLFRAVVDMKRVRNLKILVALRTNIFEVLDFGNRTGGQEEKFRSLTLNLKWHRAELEALLSERAKAAGAYHAMPEINSVKDILPTVNKSRGNALDHIFQRTLMRPRDAIAYFNKCYVVSGGKAKITWDNIHDAENDYSSLRLLALRDEWKPTYPKIDRVFDVFTGSPTSMTEQEFKNKLDDVVLLLADPGLRDATWMMEMTEAVWDYRVEGEWFEPYRPLMSLLFQIGFIGAKRANSNVIYFQDQADLFSQPSSLRRLTEFFVHPAFRGALDIDK